MDNKLKPENIKEHFLTVCAHKAEVMKGCFKVGLYRQGLLHDLSKFSPGEFLVGARYYGTTRTGSFPVVAQRTKHVKSVEVTTRPTRDTYVEGFVTDELRFNGTALTITWDDDTTTLWRYDTTQPDDASISFTVSKTVDSDGIVNITAGEVTATLTLNLIPDPVDHIELEKASEYKFIENLNGNWIEGKEEEEEWFFYDSLYNLTDATAKIYFKDGTTRSIGLQGKAVNGYCLEWVDTQEEQHWTVEGPNTLTMTYLGHTTTMPVNVIPNPCERIELADGACVTVMENVDGSDWGSYFHYYPTDRSVANARVNIYFTDGTMETATVWGDPVREYFVGLDTDEQSSSSPWTVGGENFATVTYLGREVQIPVVVEPNPLERLELVSAPTRSYIYGDPDWGETWSGNYSLKPQDLTGFSFIAHYKGGTQATITDADIDT